MLILFFRHIYIYIYIYIYKNIKVIYIYIYIYMYVYGASIHNSRTQSGGCPQIRGEGFFPRGLFSSKVQFREEKFIKVHVHVQNTVETQKGRKRRNQICQTINCFSMLQLKRLFHLPFTIACNNYSWVVIVAIIFSSPPPPPSPRLLNFGIFPHGKI